uniref:Ig-like domain-containing protein n=1 Tax=Astatotilapia calliptera TaxID=8154 RepID=A0A3P8NFF9_ASTCA
MLGSKSFCVKFACSLHVCMASLHLFWLPPTVRRHAVSGVRLLDDSKLPVGLGVTGYLVNITAESGQNVTLSCRANNNNLVTFLEWSKHGLRKGYLLLYRDERFDLENQHPSFKNRVELQDRQMKDGDVSLILKNVTLDDRGRYECRVETKINRRKRANQDDDPLSVCVIRGEAASWLLMFILKAFKQERLNCINRERKHECFFILAFVMIVE